MDKIEVYSPTIRRKEMDAVLTAMVEEKIGPGQRNKLLIQTVKEQLKCDYALALRSPAVALSLALKNIKNQKQESADKKPGVIISALSPVYYFQVLEDLQITPLYCDVSFDFPCMSREGIEAVLKDKPSDTEVIAVVLPHTLGFIPDASSVSELGITVIEDVSQSCKINNALDPVFYGSFCILGLEERDMITAGGGAVLFTMNKKESSVLRNLSFIADEYCLPDINAAMAIVQLKELNKNIERRKEIANLYRQSGLRTRHKRFVSGQNDEINFFSFSLVLETGLKDVVSYARKKDIVLENAFEKTIAGIRTIENCPVSNSLALRTVLFPLYPRLSSKDADSVSRLIVTLP